MFLLLINTNTSRMTSLFGSLQHIANHLISPAGSLFFGQIGQPLPLLFFDNREVALHQFGQRARNERNRAAMAGIMIGAMYIKDEAANVAEQHDNASNID